MGSSRLLRSGIVAVVFLAMSLGGVIASATSGISAPASPSERPADRTADRRLTPAVPIRLATGDGERPDVAVESDGTIHAAWYESDDTTESVGYCRLPRGATACERTELLPGPAPDGSALPSFGAPQVLIPEDGTIVILGGYCCTSIDASLVMWMSTDSGSSFSPARLIGTQVPVGSVYGPSDNAITIAFEGSYSPPAAGVQVAEVDAADGVLPAGSAVLGDPDAEQYYTGGVALLDALTPVSAFTDLENTYLRAFDARRSTSELNDEAAWLPALELPGESEPRIVSGAAGAYLMTYYNFSGDVLDGAYRVRRVTPDPDAPSGLRLSDPVLGSDPGDSLFGDITADAGDGNGNGGGITTVWTDSGATAAIKSAYAAGGGQFRAPGTLVTGARAYHLQVATAGDGGGAVVWDDNGDGGVWLAPIPAGGVPSDDEPSPTHDGGFLPPGNTPSCTTSLTVRTGVVAAVRGGRCWDREQGQVWSTTGDVNVNGIDFITDKASTRVTVDLTTDRLAATGGVLQKAGSLVFAKDAGTWDLGGTTVFEGVEKASIKLFDFPVMGRASVVFKAGRAEITANLGLPRPFDFFGGLPVTAQTVLTTTQKKGLILTGIAATADGASVGGFGVHDLRITYDAGLSEFTGRADLDLSGTRVRVGLGFRGGALTRLFFSYLDGPPFPVAVFKGVWLNGVGFGYDASDGFSLAGGGHLSFPVPTAVLAEPPLVLDGIGSPPGTGGGFVFRRAAGVTSVTVAAALEIFGFDVGHARAYVDTTGVLTFESDLSLGWERLGLRGELTGGVDAAAGTWSAHAVGEACLLLCASMQAAATDAGIGACAEIDLWLTTIGITVGFFWKGDLYASFGCDLGPFLTPPAPGAGQPGEVNVSGDGTVTIPANTTGDPRSFAIDIPGEGGVPLVTVRDGAGSVLIASDPSAPDEPQQNQPFVLSPSPATGSARLLVLQEPSLVPTVIRVEASRQSSVALARRTARRVDPDRAEQALSGPVALRVAEVVGDTAVTAAVLGAGRARSLSFQATHLLDGDRTLRFVEHASDGQTHELGATDEETGAIDFRPLAGPRGTRTIHAVVVNADGVPVSTVQVATYEAPGWVRPGKATDVEVRHLRGGRVKVTWQAPRGAARPARWQVFTRVPSGEGRLQRVAKPRLVLRGVGKRERVTVTIVGEDASGRIGVGVRARG